MSQNNQQSQPPKVDYLDVDKEIPGQRYCCMSFISPENVLKDKNMFFIRNFLNSYVAKLKIDSLEKFLVENLSKFNEGRTEQLTTDDVLGDLRTYVEENAMTFREENVLEEYETYLLKNREKLQENFDKENNFRTSVRGIKVRGTYSTYDEARARADRLRQEDPNFNVFVGQVGYWLPWDPDPSAVGEQEYAEKELNELMKNYHENKIQQEDIFREEKRLAMEEALRQNRTRSQRSNAEQIKNGTVFQNKVIPGNMFGADADPAHARHVEQSNTQNDNAEEGGATLEETQEEEPHPASAGGGKSKPRKD
jgi:hypothetical protein